MNTIEVDGEVYAFLVDKRSAFETENEVLRRLLLDARSGQSGKGAKTEAPVLPGALLELLAQELVHPDDELECHQKRKHQTFHGAVNFDGRIRTRNGLYAYPSPALGELVGTQIDGWAHWIHKPSGLPLRQLRDRLKK